MNIDELAREYEKTVQNKQPIQQVQTIYDSQIEHEKEVIHETYQRQQDAIRRSETTRIEITQGIKNGQDVTQLFLLACRCISDITGDAMLTETACRHFKAK